MSLRAEAIFSLTLSEPEDSLGKQEIKNVTKVPRQRNKNLETIGPNLFFNNATYRIQAFPYGIPITKHSVTAGRTAGIGIVWTLRCL